MLFWPFLMYSGKNTTADWRRALFGIYYAEDDAAGRDLRTEYYEDEAANRRAKGSKRDGGKANKYHTGEPVVVEQGGSAA